MGKPKKTLEDKLHDFLMSLDQSEWGNCFHRRRLAKLLGANRGELNTLLMKMNRDGFADRKPYWRKIGSKTSREIVQFFVEKYHEAHAAPATPVRGRRRAEVERVAGPNGKRVVTRIKERNDGMDVEGGVREVAGQVRGPSVRLPQPVQEHTRVGGRGERNSRLPPAPHRRRRESGRPRGQRLVGRSQRRR